jgi:hypothetical protein
MELLHAHIERVESQAYVYTKNRWPSQSVNDQVNDAKHLQRIDSAYPRPKRLTFLLLDEAQHANKKEWLWHFFRGVCDGFHTKYCAILFCSYGSPFASPVS